MQCPNTPCQENKSKLKLNENERLLLKNNKISSATSNFKLH